MLDEPGLRADERFRENAGRMTNRAALVEILGRCFARRPTAEWVELLEAAGVPAGPVLSVEEMLDHPQSVARGMVGEVEHAALGRIRAIGPPVKFDGTVSMPSRGAPVLGEHTREVLGELGLSPERIDALAEAGVVIDGSGATAGSP